MEKGQIVRGTLTDTTSFKPFGFCIYGCIDGYSRRIMWLEVGITNSNPAIIRQYFLDCVKQGNCTP